MKKIIEKTKEEREEAITFTEIKVKDTDNFYFSCDACGVAFFDEDIILKDSKKYHRCPLKIKNGIFKKEEICRKKIYGGDEKSFNEYYKIKE